MRLIHAKVRSTIHRLGRTSKPAASDRFTICNFHAPGAPDHESHLLPCVSTISEDALDEREQASRPQQQWDGTVAILDIAGSDEDIQQEAERVDQNMALAARRLFAGIIARRVERGPPFEAPRAVWLSMIATVGLASRPCRSRS